MGPGQHTSRPDEAQSVYPHEPPRERTHAGKPHKHRYGKIYDTLPYPPPPFASIQLTKYVQLFKRIVRQYDGMRKRNAFMKGYKKTAPFSENLTEFDEARQVVTDLIAEYEAAEEANYLNPDEGQATSADNDKRMG